MNKTLLTAALALAAAPLPAAAAPFLTLVDPGIVGEGFIECVKLVSPEDTENPEGCNNGADVPTFMRFLTRGMTEQSYTLQHLSLQGSAVLPGADGLSLGLQLKTFPFAMVENLVGKSENTSFIPVFPSLEASWVARGEAVDWSLGVAVAPPVTVAGATTRLLGASGALARDMGDVLRLGLEADATVGYALAPVVATHAQYEAGELDANTDLERYEAICAPQDYGCIDTLSMAHLTARVGAVFRVSEVAQPYVKLGVQRFTDTFDVQVDLSSWRLTATLPTAALGVNLVLHDRLRAALGVSSAYRPDTLYESGPPLFYRVEAGISYVLGG